MWTRFEHFIVTVREKVFQKIEKFFDRKIFGSDVSQMTVYALIGIYTITFSYFSIRKHGAFRTYAWDLGIFNQALWTTLKNGQLFYYTPELYFNLSGSFFAVHYSPILFLVLPIYAVYQAPETLLAFQSFILALSALPLYKFSKNVFNHKLASVAIVLAYFFYPPLHGVNWFDFHPQSFLPFLFFSALYYLRTGKWLKYFIFIILSLAVMENVSFTVFFVGIYCFWIFRKRFSQAVRERNLKSPEVLIPSITLSIAIIWFYIVTWIQKTFFPIDPDYLHIYKAINNWSVLGVKDDPVKIPFYALLNPWKSLEALTYDAYLKLLYIMLLFGPLLFLSFKSSLSVITLVWLGPALLSNYQPYYGIFSQYPAYLIPFIFVAAIEGTKKKIQNSQTKNLNVYIKNILILGLISVVFLSPISPLIITLSDRPLFAESFVPNVTRHEELLQEMINLVPSNSSILTQNNIFPHFSSRANAYVYPIAPVLQQAPQKINFYIDGLFKKSEYILADVVSDSYTANLIISRVNEMEYGLYAFADGIYLYKRGYEGLPFEVSK